VPRLFLLAIFVVTASTVGRAQQSSGAFEEELRRPTLKGLPGVFLLINTPALLPPEDRTSIRTEAELILRSAGIRLYSVDEYLKEPSAIPGLLLTVSATAPSTSAMSVAWASASELSQGVYLARDTEIYAKAVTWKLNGSFGLGPRDSILSTTREQILNGVRAFANAYLAVNPRGGSSQEERAFAHSAVGTWVDAADTFQNRYRRTKSAITIFASSSGDFGLLFEDKPTFQRGEMTYVLSNGRLVQSGDRLTGEVQAVLLYNDSPGARVNCSTTAQLVLDFSSDYRVLVGTATFAQPRPSERSPAIDLMCQTLPSGSRPVVWNGHDKF
jgi:hypothetical protein